MMMKIRSGSLKTCVAVMLTSVCWPGSAQAVEPCLIATGRAQEGCFNGANATTARPSEKAFMMKACELNSMVALKSCREGLFQPPAGDASACEAAKAYASALAELGSLASTGKVHALVKEGGGFAFHGKDLLKMMKGLPEFRRHALLDGVNTKARKWFSGISSTDGTPCNIARPYATDNRGAGPWR